MTKENTTEPVRPSADTKSMTLFEKLDAVGSGMTGATLEQINQILALADQRIPAQQMEEELTIILKEIFPD